jgi:hypothetical protein
VEERMVAVAARTAKIDSFFFMLLSPMSMVFIQSIET